jgi:diacylglycerol kinase (ATP)
MYHHIGMLLYPIGFKSQLQMKHAHLFHNPGAGDEKHSKENLLAILEANGYSCGYSSTDIKGWEAFSPHVELLIVAGGDGTVRKVATHLLQFPYKSKNIPITLLPLGTANNIARTLGVMQDPEILIPRWKDFVISNYDIGKVVGFKKDHWMLESFGFGLFPFLMMKMEQEQTAFTPRKELQSSLELLFEIIQSYEPRFCKLTVDGTDHSGKFLLAEVMNIKSIGPILNISPYGDPLDEEFEVVLVPEKQKKKFATYVKGRINGLEETFAYHTLKGKKIKISWEGTHVHIDDKIVKIPKNETIRITLEKGALQFMVPNTDKIK